MKGVAAKWARLHNTGKGGDAGGSPTRIPNTAMLSGLPEKQRFPALVAMMRSGKLRANTKNPVFILGEGTAKHGLYRFRSGAIPGKRLRRRKDQDMFFHKETLDKIQQFRAQPVHPPKWDWRKECVRRLHGFFDIDFIFKNYIAPIFRKMGAK
jgi:hypothetical protein